MTSRSDFDRLIDDVARGATAPAAGADVRARVAARLTPRRRSAGAWMPELLSAAAAVVLVMVGLRFGGRVESPTPGTSDRTNVANAKGAPEISSKTSASTVIASRLARRPVGASVAALPPAARPIPALGPSAVIQPVPLASPLLSVTTVESAPLALTPLADTPGGHN